ncbi:hypothetical protein HDU67_000268 [Dinochytrium kinnereticum]|nr:hypothetical protein HDU67_000268 [Dinochytrium kinnereticum]
MNATSPDDDDGLFGETDWNVLLHTFFSDVFEGQIITSIAVIIGLGLLCLKEYIVMNTPLDANGNPVNPDERADGAQVEGEGGQRPRQGRMRRVPRPRPLWGEAPNNVPVPAVPAFGPFPAPLVPGPVRDPALIAMRRLRQQQPPQIPGPIAAQAPAPLPIPMQAQDQAPTPLPASAPTESAPAPQSLTTEPRPNQPIELEEFRQALHNRDFDRALLLASQQVEEASPVGPSGSSSAATGQPAAKSQSLSEIVPPDFFSSLPGGLNLPELSASQNSSKIPIPREFNSAAVSASTALQANMAHNLSGSTPSSQASAQEKGKGPAVELSPSVGSSSVESRVFAIPVKKADKASANPFKLGLPKDKQFSFAIDSSRGKTFANDAPGFQPPSAISDSNLAELDSLSSSFSALSLRDSVITTLENIGEPSSVVPARPVTDNQEALASALSNIMSRYQSRSDQEQGNLLSGRDSAGRESQSQMIPTSVTSSHALGQGSSSTIMNDQLNVREPAGSRLRRGVVDGSNPNEGPWNVLPREIDVEAATTQTGISERIIAQPRRNSGSTAIPQNVVFPQLVVPENINPPAFAQPRRNSGPAVIAQNAVPQLPWNEPAVPQNINPPLLVQNVRPIAPLNARVVPQNPRPPAPRPIVREENDNARNMNDAMPPGGGNNRPVALNVNVAVEVGPNGIAAEVQAQGDINAFLELVGMQGPLENLGQNMITVVFVIVVAIGAGVWLPFITGKAIVWLITDVYAPVVDTALSYGTSWLHTFTDPLLDPIVDGVVILLTWTGLATQLGRDVTKANVTAVETRIPLEDGLTAPSSLSPVLEEVLSLTETISSNDTNTTQSSNAILSLLDGNATLGTGTENLASSGNGSDEALATLREAHQSRIREAAKRLREPDTARLWGMPEQLAHTLVGYATHLTLVYYHSQRTGRLNHPYAQTMKRISLKWLVYLSTALKFTFFIVIELGMFPTFCGALIDLCTLPVFGPTATIASRWAFYKAFPWSSWFLHWLAGTCFMFQFAIYISTVRKVVRPGVVWFIRDPDDPAFHPMQDIIEKPILLQLRKLAVGTATYAFIVVLSVGGFVTAVRLLELLLGSPQSGALKIWPIKWEFSEPLSEFPIDLLIFHFVLPWAVAWVRPRQIFRAILDGGFRFIARRLRLTNFLFGDRMRDEESDTEEDEEDIVPVRIVRENDPPAPAMAPHAADDIAVINEESDDDEWVDEETDGEGSPVPSLNPGEEALENAVATPAMNEPNNQMRRPRSHPYLRVPNHDHVEIIPRQRMMVPMARGEALFGRANETEEEVRANWRRVYIPDRFRFRIFALLLIQWMGGLALAVCAIVCPLLLGRAVFAIFYEYMNEWDPHAANSTMPLSSVGQIHNETSFFSGRNMTSFNATSGIGSSAATYLIRRLGVLGAPSRPEVPTRPDLPVHDLFSFSLGWFLVITLSAGALWAERTFKGAEVAMRRVVAHLQTVFWNAAAGNEVPPNGEGLVRRHQSSGAVLEGAGAQGLFIAQPNLAVEVEREGEVDGPEPVEKISVWVRLWAVCVTLSEYAARGFDLIRAHALDGFKLSILIVWVGFVIPLLFGLLFQLYVVLPASAAREQTRILFFLQDWALGAMYTKVIYTLALAGPDTQFRRTIATARDQMRNGGLNRLNIRPLVVNVILPVVGFCTVLLLPPLGLGSVFDIVLATEAEDGQGSSAMRIVFRYSVLLLLAGGAGYEIFFALRRLFQRWMNQVRDDYYLVGRRLHNLGDVNNEAPVPLGAQGDIE